MHTALEAKTCAHVCPPARTVPHQGISWAPMHVPRPVPYVPPSPACHDHQHLAPDWPAAPSPPSAAPCAPRDPLEARGGAAAPPDDEQHAEWVSEVALRELV